MAKIKQPTESELEILQILWEVQEAKVKDVHEKIGSRRDIGYTTVLKLMQIMYEKNIIDRKPNGKSHIYFPILKKEEVQDKLLDKVLSSVYNGSAYTLVMSALGNYKASASELEEIKELIQKQQDKLK
jgi:BlaI family transcriptional regulator, penicillinase repressor